MDFFLWNKIEMFKHNLVMEKALATIKQQSTGMNRPLT